METETIIENGFKKTRIGLIPKDWGAVPVKDSYEFTTKPRGLDLNKISKIPFIPMELIPDQEKIITRHEFRDKISSGTFVLRDDLLVAKITPSFENGKQGILRGFPSEFAYATTEVWPLHEVNGKSDIDYLYFFLKKADVRNDIAGKMEGSTGRQRVPKSVIENWVIALPPLLEQQKISAVLSKIQHAIEQLEKIIQITKDLKKSLMNKLFTEGLYGEERKETEIGLIPKNWEVSSVGDACEKPQYGYTETASRKPIGPKFLRITDITERGVDWAEVPYCKCAQELIEKYKLQKEDILFARIGATTGKSYIVKDCPLTVYASYLIRIRTKKGVFPTYLYYFFDSEVYWQQINANKGSSLKMGVNGSILAALKFPLPKLEEQKEIADTLASIDKKISQAESRKATLRHLFKTMLNQLMTGRVRVKDLDIQVN